MFLNSKNRLELKLWIKKQPEFMSNGFINKKGLKTLREYKYENMG